MARSPSPARRRDRSPDYRRRSRSPRRPSRRSPDYKEYDRRDRRRDDGPPPGRGGPPAGRRNQPYEDVSDDGINAESFADHRRQKRIKMMERQIRCIWRNTPSPPPEERARLVAELELQNRPPSPKPTAPADLDPELEALAGAMVPAAGPEPEEEDEILADLNSREVTMFTAWLADQKTQAALALEARARQEEEDRVVGPEPPSSDYQVDADYGTHLRPGEGDAMAAYVQAGQRIPRRGEVGLTSDQISQYEEAGYVMSGSRHARMNAVRIRKENQVYTAEEKAALAMVNFEEKKKKEAAILDDMKRLVDRTLGPALPPAPADEEGDA